MRFCQLCCNTIKDGEKYFESWDPVHHLQCMECHDKRKKKVAQ